MDLLLQSQKGHKLSNKQQQQQQQEGRKDQALGVFLWVGSSYSFSFLSCFISSLHEIMQDLFSFLHSVVVTNCFGMNSSPSVWFINSPLTLSSKQESTSSRQRRESNEEVHQASKLLSPFILLYALSWFLPIPLLSCIIQWLTLLLNLSPSLFSLTRGSLSCFLFLPPSLSSWIHSTPSRWWSDWIWRVSLFSLTMKSLIPFYLESNRVSKLSFSSLHNLLLLFLTTDTSRREILRKTWSETPDCTLCLKRRKNRCKYKLLYH